MTETNIEQGQAQPIEPTILIGIITAGDIVAAYPLPNGEPTEAMKTHYAVFVASNMDAGSLVVTPDRWERIRAALSEQDDVTVQDFTTA